MNLAHADRSDLGAPKVVFRSPRPPHRLAGVRLDVCAFLGLAMRGPAFERELPVGFTYADAPDACYRRSVPIAVESFEEFRARFGGFDAPGQLAQAVAAYFDQGGVRAYVVRIVPRERESALGARARGAVYFLATDSGAPVTLLARNEGTWGLQLRAALHASLSAVAETGAETHSRSRIVIAPGELSVGDLVLDRGGRVAWVEAFEPRPGGRLEARLSGAVEGSLERVSATLTVADAERNQEVFANVGLAPAHPRYLARVLHESSVLVTFDDAWVGQRLLPGDLSGRPGPAVDALPSFGEAGAAENGAVGDRHAAVTADDFFAVLAEEPEGGAECLLELDDLTQITAPDLLQYRPGEVGELLVPAADASGEFEPCGPKGSAEAHVGLAAQFPQLEFDTLDEAASRQARLVAVAERSLRLIALLDAPRRFTPADLFIWRKRFTTSYAAAYHPFLLSTRAIAGRPALVSPSAVAAGIIAKSELERGVAQGPANRVAAEIVDLEIPVSSRQRDGFHPAGINAFSKEREGVKLESARTLSQAPETRQISVRRLLILLRRTLERQLRWVVFEPNDAALHSDVADLIRRYLRDLFAAGAFRGKTEREAFFVRFDPALNDRSARDGGRLIAEIGVALAEPLEFIVVQLLDDNERILSLEVGRGH